MRKYKIQKNIYKIQNTKILEVDITNINWIREPQSSNNSRA